MLVGLLSRRHVVRGFPRDEEAKERGSWITVVAHVRTGSVGRCERMAAGTLYRFERLLKNSLQVKRSISPSVRWIETWLSHGTEDPHSTSSVKLSNLPHHSNQSSSRLSTGCIHHHRNLTSSATLLQAPVVQQTGNLPEEIAINPFKLSERDLSTLYADIRQELWTQRPELKEIAAYYFDGQGKAFRPMIIVLVARALNFHLHNTSRILESQRKVAMITEMIHTASLVHDDVIDTSDTRRGKPSVNVRWGQKKAILAGDFILSRAGQMLARLRDEEVIIVLSQVLLDLVQGEFMQMGSKEDENERFSHYLQKSFKKTASLIAYTCKAVALLAGANSGLQEAAFQYGRNVGIAFQLVDDLLDFVSSQADLGKPAAADLRLGLATAPVLFACEKFPELNVMIMRRFSEPGDVERAYEAVMKSDGLDHTRLLARKHCDEALKYIAPLVDSQEKQALVTIAEMVLTRNK